MKIRSLTKEDLPRILLLLCEGFPRRSRDYWVRALDVLGRRAELPGFPRFGWGLEADGEVHGILIVIADVADGQRRANLSSWYVREPYRAAGFMMLRRAMAERGVTYTDLSPAPNVLPIALKLGFRPYTGGMAMLTAIDALRPGGSAGAPTADEERAFAARIGAQIGYGNTPLMVGGAPALYRLKWLKRAVPAAQFTFGDPHMLVGNAGALMRALLRRGVPVALFDLPPGFVPDAGRHMPGRQIRYATGGPAPRPGDLCETEIALFGP